MARSVMQRRQEAERARVEAYEASLRRVSQRARPAPNFQNTVYEVQDGFENHVLRDAHAWRPHLKTHDPARVRLAAARYLFARYPVAEHLERIWADRRGLLDAEVAMRKRWYITAASGGSLYRAGAGAWLSRREVHAFLNPAAGLGFDAAIWHSIAGSYANDPAVALRIARSRIVQAPRAELGFWREVTRFFCTYPTTIEAIDDLCDYLEHCHRRDPAFSLKGRTLGSLGRQMREWHRDLDAIARIEAARRRAEAAPARARRQAAPQSSDDGRWQGAALADWSVGTTVKDPAKRGDFVVVQLRSAEDLVAESRAMHHCVSAYASKCMAGNASIWSLRRRAGARTERLLTIELDRYDRAVQIRGFANRAPGSDELTLLARWARAHGVGLP